MHAHTASLLPLLTCRGTWHVGVVAASTPTSTARIARFHISSLTTGGSPGMGCSPACAYGEHGADLFHPQTL